MRKVTFIEGCLEMKYLRPLVLWCRELQIHASMSIYVKELEKLFIIRKIKFHSLTVEFVQIFFSIGYITIFSSDKKKKL